MKKINISFNNTRKTFFTIIVSVVLPAVFESCTLDVVPDNIPTIEKAFTLQAEAEKYLYTCYSYLPKNGNVETNIGMLSGDEIWVDRGPYRISLDAVQIARGAQRVSNPYQNVWDGTNNFRLFNGIRHCNVFLENIRDLSKAPDLETDIELNKRQRWIGEAEFLKAYYHFCLLKMYGPIPIIDTNVDISASDSEISVKRQPVDACVDYIVKTLDDAIEKLPVIVPVNQAGRITKTIALATKAKVLLLAASPLFNGNSDFSSLRDKQGQALFNPSADINKWKLAADAALAAIESAKLSGHDLYKEENFTDSRFKISSVTKRQMVIRQSFLEKETQNPEIIWSNPNSTSRSGSNLQLLSMPPLAPLDGTDAAQRILSVPIKIARMFYTKNGVPIDEDKDLSTLFQDEKFVRKAVPEENYYIGKNASTAQLNFDREPRFYADLGFDGGVWFNAASSFNTNADQTLVGTDWVLKAKSSNPAGSDPLRRNVTGYFIKKLVDWNSSVLTGYQEYAWPELRLSELYLMYAEALNEFSGPSQTVYDYLDLIRDRAGLKGVVESWRDFSNNPDKPSTKVGLRAIIHQERNIELAFEGQRYWDLLRWKTAAEVLNQPITGWNVVSGAEAVSYYQPVTVFNQKFVTPRDYFWPISQSELSRNPNLVQNLGW